MATCIICSNFYHAHIDDAGTSREHFCSDKCEIEWEKQIEEMDDVRIFSNSLTLSDLTTDPPKNADICENCGGWRLVVTWVSGPMQTSEDCPICKGNGWVIVEKPDMTVRT